MNDTELISIDSNRIELVSNTILNSEADNNSRLNTVRKIMNNTIYNSTNIPDYSYYIYSTMKNTQLYTMNRNNMPTPIKYDSGVSLLESDGVYIIEKYNIPINQYIDGYTVMQYMYDSIPNMNILDKEQKDELARTITHDMHKQGTLGGIPPNVSVIHFIPASYIEEFSKIYYPKCNIVIMSLRPNEDISKIMHPDNELAKDVNDIKTISELPEDNLLSINIQNAENKNKVYYIKVGSGTHRVYVDKKNTTRPDGFNIRLKVNGEIKMNKRGTLEELAKYGIHDQKDLAMYDGNSKSVLDFSKLNYDLEKLRADKAKLKYTMSYDKKSYETELQRLTLDLIAVKEKRAHEKVMAQFDLDQDIMKRDLAILKYSHEIEMNKLKIEQMQTDNTFDMSRIFLVLLRDILGLGALFLKKK